MVPQKLNVTLHFPYDIDNNFVVRKENIFKFPLDICIQIEYLKVYYSMYTVKNPLKPVKLLESSDKRGPCKFLNQFAGALWYDVQSRAGLLPNSCPIPKVRTNLQFTIQIYNKPLKKRSLLNVTY